MGLRVAKAMVQQEQDKVLEDTEQLQGDIYRNQRHSDGGSSRCCSQYSGT